MELLIDKGYVSFNAFKYFAEIISRDKKKTNKYLQIIAELIRYNTLLSVARAGTGHLGTSLSIVELLTEIYFRSFNFSPQTLKSNGRDIFILSKGHAAPSLYSTLAAKGYIPIDKLDSLRRLGGLAGHCDIETAGIEANTGSLAMGLSKAVGYAIAKQRFGLVGNVIVIVGDGELQEGQCWEALLSAASFKLDNLYIIIDDNKVQTDRYTKDIINYGDLKDSIENFGFAVAEESGRTLSNIHKSLKKLQDINNKPKLFWCHTIKGQGVSFMEHPNVLKERSNKYIWHNKAPNSEQLELALKEIIGRIDKELKSLGFSWSIEKSLDRIPIVPMASGIEGKSLTVGFAQGLVELAGKFKYFVALDGDLEEDCGYIEFHKKYPDRFFEMGIMEQHMVLTASAMARLGYTPIISTYAAFLTSRANEQIYNLATEKSKALVVGNMSGVIPATPGKSHQAFRDIACIKNIPEISMYQPISADDTKNVLSRYLEGELGDRLYLRLSMAPSAVELSTPDNKLKKGKSHILKTGKDIIVIGIGPVVLGECMKAVKDLARKEIDVEVWNHPWLCEFDYRQLREASARKIPLLIVEDHYKKGGFGESLLSFLALSHIDFPKIYHIGLTKVPQTGFREEALKYFGLHFNQIQEIVQKLLQ